jgi:preprotein translocase subunit SecA
MKKIGVIGHNNIALTASRLLSESFDAEIIMDNDKYFDEVDISEISEMQKHFVYHNRVGEMQKHFVYHNRVEQYVRDKPKIGRNEPCPCGSDKKYKKCCIGN